MAQLVGVPLTDWLRLPGDSNYVLRTYSLASLTTDATDEWLWTGMDTIVGVVGYGHIDTDGAVEDLLFELNAQGTADTPGDVPGALGVEGGSNEALVHITVLGVRAEY